MGLFGGGDDDDSTDPQIARLVEAAEGDSVTADVLTEMKQGFVDENLTDQPIAAYLRDGEQPEFVLSNLSNGVTVSGPSGPETTKSVGAHKSFAVVTDRRVLILVGAHADQEVSLPYGAIEGATLEPRKRSHRDLFLRGERRSCTFPVNGNDIDADEVEAARRYVARQARAADRSVGDAAFAVRPAGTDNRLVANMPDRGDRPLASGRGVTSPVAEVYDDRVVLVSTSGARTLSADAVTGVEFSEPSDGDPGYLYFDQQGHDRPDALPVAKADAENAVTFPADCTEAAQEIRRAVERLLRGGERRESAPVGDSGGDGSDGSDGDSGDDEALRILRERFARGDISVEEFEARLELLEETT